MPSSPAASHDTLTRGVFIAATFLSAWLLFAVQPMVAAMLLPRLGGSPAVWNTALVFFQATLLGGYVLAHLLADRFTGSVYRVAQLTLLVAALPILPIALPGGWIPPVETSPAGWTLLVLGMVVGVPFLALSTMSPTLQAWFARSGHPGGANPYFLYAAGNVGSFLGLVTYPLVVEPALSLGAQSRAWAVGYVTLLGLVVTAAWLSRAEPRTARAIPLKRSPRVGWRRRLTWSYLAFVPSMLLLGVTRHLATDVAGIPLLWVLPLGLYLLSFVVIFGGTNSDRTVLVSAVVVAATGPLALTLSSGLPVVAHLLIPLLFLTAAAMVAHGRAYATRPPADRLTEFYVWISTGGVTGGLVAALVIPAVAEDIVEYPLAIALSLALAPGLIGTFGSSHARRRLLRGLAVALALGALIPTYRLAVGDADLIFRERTFFGVHKVQEAAGGEHVLISGTTIHGWQDLTRDPVEAAGYYTEEGPIGQAIGHLQSDRQTLDIGVVGLGAGGLAAYSRPGDRLTFYEIDPVVIDIALDDELFTYLAKARGDIELTLGDGRIQIEQSTNRHTLIVLDAFTSDAIPTHLLTTEALSIYLQHLEGGGMLAFNISNRYVDLEGVLGRAADELGLVGLAQTDARPASEPGVLSSIWVVLARDAEHLAGLPRGEGAWLPVRSDGPLWTDDHSALLPILRLW